VLYISHINLYTFQFFPSKLIAPEASATLTHTLVAMLLREEVSTFNNRVKKSA